MVNSIIRPALPAVVINTQGQRCSQTPSFSHLLTDSVFEAPLEGVIRQVKGIYEIETVSWSAAQRPVRDIIVPEIINFHMDEFRNLSLRSFSVSANFMFQVYP